MTIMSSGERIGLYGEIRLHSQEDPVILAMTAHRAGKAVVAESSAELWREYHEAEAAGELFKLLVTIVSHLNNLSCANFWDIKSGAYKRIAKSFVGKPFQRDHSLKQEDRGGKIIESKAEGAGEEARMVQVIEAVKPWAIKGFLDGTFDRFSIHINAHDIKAICSICGADIERCAHWPGDAYENVSGEMIVCRVVVTEGSGKETSAVVDPAVSGTAVESIQKIAASLRGSNPPLLEDDKMTLEQLQAALASKEAELSGKGTELVEVQAARQQAETALKAEQEAHVQSKEELGLAYQEMLQMRADACAAFVDKVRAIRASDEILFGAESFSFEITPETDLAAEEDRLQRTLLADQILVERNKRHDGPDFDVIAERERLMLQKADALQLALEQWRLAPLLANSPVPRGEGSPLRPGDGTRADPAPPASNTEDKESVETFAVEDITALATGRATISNR